MKIHEMHNNVELRRVVAPVAVGTTGTGKTGEIIDRQGYGGVEFLVGYGAVTATSAVFSVTIMEGDTTGALTSVADADLIGTELAAGLAAAVRVDGSTEKVIKKVGYKGNKRYVQANISSTATAGTPVSIEAMLFNPASTTAQTQT